MRTAVLVTTPAAIAAPIMTCGPLLVVKFLTFMCFSAFFQSDCYAQQTYSTGDDFLPVVYVIYGQIPLYLRINIELASRNNDVVVISNEAKAKGSQRQLSTFDATSLSRSTKITANGPFRIFYEDIALYFRSADLFAPHYVHLSPDHNHNRIRHELRCFQRWFVLKEFMLQHGIAKAFFGDGDSSVFMNIKSAVKHREHCSAIISIDAQAHDLYWCAAGESSVWTTVAIVDFCAFTFEMYSHKVQILRIKDAGRTSVVDMSLLWLWWVSHQKESKSGWDTGRPFLSDHPMDNANQLQAFRDRSDAAYAFSKKLNLPVYNSTKVSLELAAAKVPLEAFRPSNNLTICNGMDVVNRTVFDHRAGWRSGQNQSLNLIGITRHHAHYSFFQSHFILFASSIEGINHRTKRILFIFCIKRGRTAIYDICFIG